MKYLPWDESAPRVLAWYCFVTGFADVTRDTLARCDRLIRPWRILNEFPSLFPPCHGRADSGSDLTRSWQCAGAIAACGASRGQHAGDADACRVRNTRPGADRNPGPGRPPFSRAWHTAGGSGDPGAAGWRAGADRGSVRRGNHAGAANGRP